MSESLLIKKACTVAQKHKPSRARRCVIFRAQEQRSQLKTMLTDLQSHPHIRTYTGGERGSAARGPELQVSEHFGSTAVRRLRFAIHQTPAVEAQGRRTLLSVVLWFWRTCCVSGRQGFASKRPSFPSSTFLSGHETNEYKEGQRLKSEDGMLEGKSAPGIWR